MSNPDRNTVRLLIQKDAATGEIAAIDLGTKTQVLVGDGPEHYNFFVDLIGIQQGLANRYNAGKAIACYMNAADWQAWSDHYDYCEQDRSHVWLSCSAERDLGPQAITAMDLTTQREVVVVDDKAAFVEDAQGWDAPAYGQALSFVCRMTCENWALWLAEYEVSDLDVNLAALIGA